MGLLVMPPMETREVRAALVGELAYSVVPTTIMGFTLVGMASLAFAYTGSYVFLATAVVGAPATMAKVALMGRQSRQGRMGSPDGDTMGTYETAHLVLTIAMAMTVGATACAMFLDPDLRLRMLATGLIFGYCSGVVARVGMRPRIALPALVVSSVPSILVSFLRAEMADVVLATVFTTFLLGSVETVMHVHRTAVRHVVTRLEMASLARLDPLTGLSNRLGLREAFAALPADHSVAILFLDLDGFKPVNDRYGHAVGDSVLRAVGQRMLAVAGPNTTVARVGGDEFVVMRPGGVDGSGAAALATHLDTALREPFLIHGFRVTIGASVGHVTGSGSMATLDDLLTQADEASYRVKRAGRSGTEARTASLRVVA